VAESNKAGGVVLGAGAAILAALLASGKVKAANGLTADELIQQAAQADSASGTLDSIDKTLKAMSAYMTSPGRVINGQLANPHTFTTFQMTCAAANVAYRLPDKAVPYGMSLVIKALVGNFGNVYIGAGTAEAANLNTAYPLIANEAVELQIINSMRVYVSAAVAGDGIVCIVEQKEGGG